MKIRSLLPALPLLFSLFAADARGEEEQPPIISRITLRATDIYDFDTNPYLNRFPYNWINLLHFQTKRKILEQEILVRVGEVANDFLIAETERNLRALSFIRAARIARFPQRDGTVVLVVHVNDSWTTEPQLNLEGLNKIDDVEIGFKEKNLFGYGKSLSFFYNTDSDTDFQQQTYRFKDPRVFGSWWKFQSTLINKTDGEEKSVELGRPFYSAHTLWSVASSYSNSEETLDDLDVNNVKVSEFDQHKEVSQVSMAIKVGPGHRIVNRAGLRYRIEKQTYERTNGTAAGRAIPQAQDLQSMFLDMTTSRSKFIKATRVEKMTRIEDINLGPSIRVSPGGSFHELTGKRNSTELQTSYEQNYQFQGTHLLRTNFDYSSRRTFENPTNLRYKFDARYYHRHSIHQTLVLHTRFERGEDLDSDNQITLGGDSGLRSFKNESMQGNKSLLLNIEDRVYLIDNLWDLFAVGGVLFYDTGYAWPRERPVSLSRMRSDIGAGLRLGLTHSSSEVIVRFDVAYRLHRLDSNDPKWVFSFGSGQVF